MAMGVHIADAGMRTIAVQGDMARNHPSHGCNPLAEQGLEQCYGTFGRPLEFSHAKQTIPRTNPRCIGAPDLPDPGADGAR